MMSSKKALKIFESTGAILHNDHFVYTSGRHGSDYVNKDAVYPYRAIHSLCTGLVRNFRAIGYNAEAIVAPVNGGIVLARLVADAVMRLPGHKKFKSQSDVLAVYAEKTENGQLVIRRGYDKLIAGRWVVVIDDVVTTGGSLRKVVEAVRACEAKVVGAAVLWNRSGISIAQMCRDLKLDFFESLISCQFPSWNEADCPLCKQGVPVNKDVGKGGEFYIRKMQAEVAEAANRAAAEVLGGKKK